MHFLHRNRSFYTARQKFRCGSRCALAGGGAGRGGQRREVGPLTRRLALGGGASRGGQRRGVWLLTRRLALRARRRRRRQGGGQRRRFARLTGPGPPLTCRLALRACRRWRRQGGAAARGPPAGGGQRRGGSAALASFGSLRWRSRAKLGGGQQRMLRSRCSACAFPHWRGVGGSALEGESAATLGRWRRRVGVGASSAARQRRFSRLALGWAL